MSATIPPDWGASEIMPGLWLGDLADAIVDGDSTRLHMCVLENRPLDLPAKAMHVRIVESYAQHEPRQVLVSLAQVRKINPTARAHPRQLDAAAMVIANCQHAGWDLLVHCAAGKERSPLTIVWYLVHYDGMSIDDAYALVRAKRPQVWDCRDWLP